MAEGATAAKDEHVNAGAEAERERIQAVAGCAMPGHETLIDKLMYDGTTSGGDAALAIVAAEKQVRIVNLQNLNADGVDPVAQVLPIDPIKKVKTDGPATEDVCKAEFEADAAIQDEFGSFDAYFAYRKGMADGRVRVLKK